MPPGSPETPSSESSQESRGETGAGSTPAEKISGEDTASESSEELKTRIIQPEGLAQVEVQQNAEILKEYGLEANSKYVVSGQANLSGDTVKIRGAKGGNVFIEIVSSEDFPDSVGDTTILSESQLELYNFDNISISPNDLEEEPNPEYADQELSDREERIFGELGLQKGGIYRIKDDSNLRIDAEVVQPQEVDRDNDPRFKILAGPDGGANREFVRIDNIRESIDEFVPVQVEGFEGLSKSLNTENIDFETGITKINKRGIILDIDELYDDETDIEKLLRDKYQDAEESIRSGYINRVRRANPESEVLQELGVEAGKIYTIEEIGGYLSGNSLQVIGYDSDTDEVIVNLIDGDGDASGIFEISPEGFSDYVLSNDETYQLVTGEIVDSTGGEIDPNSELLAERDLVAGNIYNVDKEQTLVEINKIKILGATDGGDIRVQITESESEDLKGEIVSLSELGDPELSQPEQVNQSEGAGLPEGISEDDLIDVRNVDSSQTGGYGTIESADPESGILDELNLEAGAVYRLANGGDNFRTDADVIQIIGVDEASDPVVKALNGPNAGRIVDLKQQNFESNTDEYEEIYSVEEGLVDTDTTRELENGRRVDTQSEVLAENDIEVNSVYEVTGDGNREGETYLILGAGDSGRVYVRVLDSPDYPETEGDIEYFFPSDYGYEFDELENYDLDNQYESDLYEGRERQTGSYENVQFTEVTLPNGETVLRSVKPRGGTYLLANKVFVPPEEPDGEVQKAVPDLDASKTYSVKVNFDGNRYPDFDEDIYTPVQIETQDRDLERLAEIEYEAARERTRRITDSRAMQTVLDIARSDADLWEEIKPMIDRFDDFKEGTANPDESHRDLTALFTALEKSERARELLQMAIERDFKRQSESFKELLRQNGNEASVPTLVIGSGVQGQILNSERFADNPEVLNLTVDAGSRAGGQFAEPGDDFFTWASWYINSRNRPYDREKPNRPGTAGSINPLGDKAVLQLSDVSGQTYPSQDDLSDAVRVNQFLSTQMALNTEVTEIDRSGKRAKITMTDTETGEEFIVRADQAYLTTGLGEERIGLDTDDEPTQEILNEEREKAEAGEQPQVLTFPEFMSRITDKSERFPLKDIEDITFVGWGDSTRVALEAVLGYGPEDDRNSMQLDRVKEVNVIGDDVPVTREEYLDRLGNNLRRDETGPGERPRYAQLADEWPRPNVENQEGFEELDEYNFRVNPIQGRGERLRRTGEGGSKIGVGGTFIGGANSDLVVVATGFESQIDELTEQLQEETYQGEDITENQEEILTDASEVDFTFSPENNNGLVEESVTVEDDQVNVSFRFDDGSTDETSFSRPDDSRTLGQILEVKEADEVVAEFPINNVYDEDVDDEPVGQKFASAPVYVAGPAADLELTETEKEKDPVLAAIGENAVSIFRYADKTSAIGRMAAQRERDNPNTDDSFIQDTVTKANTPAISTSAAGETALEVESATNSFVVSKNSINELPYDANSDDLMRLIIGEYFQDVVIGAGTGPENEEEAIGFQLQTNFTGADSDIADSLMSSLQNDDAFISIIERITDEDSRNEMSIIIPVDQSSGAVRAEEIRTKNPTRTSTNIESNTSGDRDADTRSVTPDW
jgi:hypothetical protein